MSAALTASGLALSPRQVNDLRARHPFEPDLSWAPDVVRTDGWLDANVRYLKGERERSTAAMRDLLRELGIDRPASPGHALDIFELAVEVFAPDGGFAGTLERESPTTLRVTNAHCPVFEAMERQQWHGFTACASWHRRRGWMDALGAISHDSILGERKWGDVACEAIIEVQSV